MYCGRWKKREKRGLERRETMGSREERHRQIELERAEIERCRQAQRETQRL